MAASYPDPIVLVRGEQVKLSGREDIWEGHRWLWAESPTGKQGWVPDSLIDTTSTPAIARRDYTAMELTCRAGDILVAIEETHGWIYCRAGSGDCGWVPARNLARLGPA